VSLDTSRVAVVGAGTELAPTPLQFTVLRLLWKPVMGMAPALESRVSPSLARTLLPSVPGGPDPRDGNLGLMLGLAKLRNAPEEVGGAIRKSPVSRRAMSSMACISTRPCCKTSMTSGVINSGATSSDDFEPVSSRVVPAVVLSKSAFSALSRASSTRAIPTLRANMLIRCDTRTLTSSHTLTYLSRSAVVLLSRSSASCV